MFIAGRALMRMVHLCPACMLRERGGHRPTTRKSTSPSSSPFPAEGEEETMANRRWRRVRVDGRGYLWLAERGRGTRRRLRLGRRGSGYWKGNAIGRGDVDNVASASARSASFEEGVSFRIIFSSKESAATKVERVETIPFRSPTNKSLTSRLLSSPSSWTVLVLNPPQPHSY